MLLKGYVEFILQTYHMCYCCQVQTHCCTWKHSYHSGRSYSTRCSRHLCRNQVQHYRHCCKLLRRVESIFQSDATGLHMSTSTCIHVATHGDHSLCDITVYTHQGLIVEVKWSDRMVST